MDPRQINSAPPPPVNRVKAGSATSRSRRVNGEGKKHSPVRKQPAQEEKKEEGPAEGEKGGLVDTVA